MTEPIKLYLDEDTIQIKVGLIVRRILKLLDTKSAAEMQNWLEFLSSWR